MKRESLGFKKVSHIYYCAENFLSRGFVPLVLHRTVSLPSVEIALMCGFANQSALSRTFCKCVGTPHRGYRKL